jgi:hypothetical protein
VPADAGTVADVSADALRWAQAIKAAAEIYLDYTRQQRDNIRGAFQVAWDGWTYEYNGERHSFTLPTSWPLTIDALVRSGLRKDDLIDGINECMYRDRVNDRFKYFCGIAWHMVRDLHDGAHEYISVSDAWDEATAGERERDGETDGAT